MDPSSGLPSQSNQVITDTLLFSTVTGLSNIAVTRIIAGSNITITPTSGLGNVTINAAGGGGVTSDQLISTTGGLGTAGYVSTPQLLNLLSTGNLRYFTTQFISSGTIAVSTLNLLDPYTGFENFLTVSSGGLLLNGAGISGGGGSGGVSQILAGSNISISPAGGTGIVTINSASIANLVSTQNLLGLVSTANLQGLVSTQNLQGLVSTQNLQGLVSTNNLQGLISTANILGLISTANILGLISTANLLGLVSTQNLQGLVSTQNLFGLVSTQNLQGLVSTQNLFGLVSTQNLQGLVSTQNLTDLVSTQNLLGLVSTANLVGLVSTVNLIGLVSTANLIGLVSTQNLIGLVSTQNLLGLVSTQNLLNLVSTANIAAFFPIIQSSFISTVAGLGTAGYVSSTQLISTVAGLGTAGYVSSTQLISTLAGLGSAGYISTSQLISTVTGLGTAGYLSTTLSTTRYSTLYVNQLITSTIWFANITRTGSNDTNYLLQVSDANLFYKPATFFSPPNVPGSQVITGIFLQSTVVGLPNIAVTKITAGSNITISPVSGLGNVTINAAAGGITTDLLISTVEGLGTAGYISSTQFLSSFQGLSNIAVTNITAGSNVTISPVSGLGNVTINASGITTGQLVSTVGGLGTALYISSSQFLSSFQGLSNIAVTKIIAGIGIGIDPLSGLGDVTITNTAPKLDDALVSTVGGLGTALYISSSQFLSSFQGLSNIAVTQLIAGSNITISPISGLGNVTINASGGGTTSLDYISTTSISSLFTSSGSFFADYASSVMTNARRFNFSSLHVNNVPILFDSNGNLQLSFQTL
jgi:hypothetical protein